MKELVFGGLNQRGLVDLRNVDTVADPSVVWRDDRWWMVLGGMVGEDRIVQLYSAESETAASGWRVVTQPDDPGMAERLADRPPPGSWDATGYHCPSYARGRNARGEEVERIYYASSSTWESLYGPYEIGFLEWDGQQWVRHGESVFRAHEPWECGTVLEPNAMYADGRWLLRYTAGLAHGAQPAVGLAESADGVTDWRRIGEPQRALFDSFALKGKQGIDLITARHPLDSVFLPEHGLWWSRADNLAEEQQLLRTNDGTPWHEAGAWKPTAVHEDGQLVVFFTSAQRGSNPYAPALGIGTLSCRGGAGQPS